MITLAVAAAFQTLASQLSRLHRRRGRPDLQGARAAAARRSSRSTSRCSACRSTARSSPTTCCSSPRLLLFLALLRIVNSPFGRVLQAIRENDFRAEAIGYRTVVYRTLANCLAALFATLAGALLALWLRYTGPDTTLSLRDHARHPADRGDRRHGHDVRRGDRRGAVRAGAELPAGPAEARRDARSKACRCWRDLCHPDRWLLWLGVLFVLSVYYFPTGIVGRLRRAGGADHERAA